MSGFDAAWLALREPADARSRSASLATALGAWLAGRVHGRPAGLLDLGCGTGANIRYLAPRLGGEQHWLAIDDVHELLGEATRASSAAASIETLPLDLARELATLESVAFDALCASALLDLVSRSWIEALVALAARRRAAVLFALSYDGHVHCSPAHDADARLHEAFDAHQRRDKGFGPALGPGACGAAATALGAAGYQVRRAASPWSLASATPADAALMRPLIDGIAAAACEQAPGHGPAFERWRDERRAQIDRAELHLVIGHEDLLALPPATPAQ